MNQFEETTLSLAIEVARIGLGIGIAILAVLFVQFCREWLANRQRYTITPHGRRRLLPTHDVAVEVDGVTWLMDFKTQRDRDAHRASQ